MSRSDNKRMRMTPLSVLSKMERSVGFAETTIAKLLNVQKAELSPIIDDMVQRGMLARKQVGHAVHLFIAGSEPGSALMPTRRPAPMENFVDITASSYCADFNRLRLLASFARGR
ncbi:hypothetical protein DF105_01180 [Burkholderia stagnalis]|uniref:hypothetical protein n=1 Tax=Burkholderia stagnalis TaxID=1503054 RepID=UPI000F603D4B|nr:hypothetical protein [Burkholderia stagnalis]RQZ08942.1 hypothetical protein DF105_01180 [Burkholderia stagnalis]